MSVSRRSLLSVMGGGVAVLGSRWSNAIASASQSLPIRIANASGNLNMTLAAVMRQERFLELFGLDPDVTDVADGSRILGAVVGGSTDVSMMSGFGQVFPAIARGAEIKILAGGALLPGLAMFSAKANIARIQDLAGKTIGTGSIGALVHQLTVSLLQKYRVDMSGIQFVNIGSSADIVRAVRVGVIDAGAGDAALIGQAAQFGVHAIDHGNMTIELPQYTFQGAWTTRQKIVSDRPVLVRALAAYCRLYRFVQSPQSHDAFMRARRTAFPSASQVDHEAQWNYIQTYKPYAVDLALTPERLNYMQSLNVQFKLQAEVLPFDRVADMSLAADALKLLAGVS